MNHLLGNLYLLAPEEEHNKEFKTRETTKTTVTNLIKLRTKLPEVAGVNDRF